MAHADLLKRLAAGLMLTASSASQALEVSPLSVTLAPGQRDDSVWLYNDSDQPWHGQARLYHWAQGPDHERLEPAVVLAVSPSELELPAHGRQRVRLVWSAASPTTEQSYRLVLRAGQDSPAVQISLPVFVAGADHRAGPALAVRVLPGPGPAVLELYNGSPRHARLSDLSFIPGHGTTQPLLPGLAGYVLAGQTRQWPLPGAASAYADGRFSARLGQDDPALLAPLDPAIAPGTGSGL
ncbi:fimbrial biogenesis chaperone [Stenotrophomonas oahuensis]|mgnify:CR=1 FL=1|uniref:Fimbria/pilus periplasmic chaperone n=1 Tax=Stenotrophomonas oahuensis TaxID=3003271 RepID=A0ABY9YLH4_9GAMM|nr:fimbria/pilus periplasmic chaperone [Stenotrophomonas sp. A5586]WNH51451.1 fimbria/pilus periplasmic chaperone [Stenotrophomonas sp. A5586]